MPDFIEFHRGDGAVLLRLLFWSWAADLALRAIGRAFSPLLLRYWPKGHEAFALFGASLLSLISSIIGAVDAMRARTPEPPPVLPPNPPTPLTPPNAPTVVEVTKEGEQL